MKRIALVFMCVLLVLFVIGSLHSGKKMALQYAAAPNDDAPELGPATHVCVTVFNTKAGYECSDLRISIDETTVNALMGAAEHGYIERHHGRRNS